MLERLKYLLTAFLLFVVIFATQKPIFMLYNNGAAADISFGDYLEVILHGLQLDVTVASYSIAIPVLVILASFFVRLPLRKILLPYYSVLMVIVAIIFNADFTLYEFWGFKLNSSVFMYTDRPGDALASVSTWFVIRRVIWILLCAGVYIWLFARITPKKFAGKPKYKLSSLIIIPVL